MKEPVDHILRPTLPWRESEAGTLTECGHDVAAGKAITRLEFFQRLKDYGQQRTAMLTCMTCSDTARRWGTWDDDPRVALYREIEWERGGAYWRARTDRGEQLKDELLAIASMIAEDREKFDTLVITVKQRREWLQKKAALEQKRPAQKERNGL